MRSAPSDWKLSQYTAAETVIDLCWQANDRNINQHATLQSVVLANSLLCNREGQGREEEQIYNRNAWQNKEYKLVCEAKISQLNLVW